VQPTVKRWEYPQEASQKKKEQHTLTRTDREKQSRWAMKMQKEEEDDEEEEEEEEGNKRCCRRKTTIGAIGTKRLAK